jgi:hypothetical protein
MDERYLHLHAKYRQEVPGCGSWSFINTLPDDELRAELEVALALREEYGPSTTEGAIGGGTIGSWIGQALRARPYLLQYPAGLI